MVCRLKEALKSICGGHHWSYAVFWKIGLQNPRLLIWEDCYYKAMPCSNLPNNSHHGNQEITLEELERCWVNSDAYGSQSGSAGEDKLQLIVNKMMVANQVHVIGQGLIGRTAFTGNHQWIVSGKYDGNGHPPEVVNEVLAQFSAGMQTLAVIPVIPLGVVQLGSSLPIIENNQFIQSVKDLILGLDNIPGAFLHDNCIAEVSSEHIDVPVNGTSFASANAFGNMNNLKSSAFSGSIGDVLHTTAVVPKLTGYSTTTESSEVAAFHPYLSVKRPLSNIFAKGEVVSVGPDVILEQQSSSDGVGRARSHGQLAGRHFGCDYMENSAELYAFQGLSDRSFMSSRSATGSQLNMNKLLFPDFPASWKSVGTEFSNGSFSMNKVDNTSLKKEEKDLYDAVNVGSSLLCGDSFSDPNNIPAACQLPPTVNSTLEDITIGSRGDDLFDVLGQELKYKILSGYACNLNEKEGVVPINQFKGNCQEATSFLNPNDSRISENCNFGTDNLLEAVVSGIHPASTQNSDDNVSCRTTVTKTSVSCTSNCSSKYSPTNVSNQKCALSEHSKPPPRSIKVGPNFTMPGFGKNGSQNNPPTSSFYGSPVSSSWLEQGLISKCEASTNSSNSKKADSVGKANRKRLKPGENPRPRPKDRQLIQDRVKELREMIPNSAKCSIDALLERTIKHMLFLQSVTEHADILKPMADSKVVNKGGELVVKDNFEGGATWAYEVGSKTMVCPVVVEDLAPPRRFLVEMLCEENGFFLEIADMIRGMGLAILNGVMEAQDKKIWARFAVEANRDITRMEIFMSLVQLLEQMSARRKEQTVEDDMSLHHPASVTGNMPPQLLLTKSQVMC